MMQRVEVPENAVQPPAPIVNPAQRMTLNYFQKDMAWALQRVVQGYPHLTERTAFAWLQPLLSNNEFLFLRTGRCIGLAQIVREHTLRPRPIVYERFVFCRNPDDKEEILEAIEIYAEFRRWGQHQGAANMIVLEQTDVPSKVLDAKVGDVKTQVMRYIRL